uniref:Secreted protein n=1 Tax=Trypanosoma vivax (strain Y486) TaxID=1055687 RepID=G0UD57_TRYVY|nr:hypothetical protein TVY486_1112520 [Trypanosoma vivax Y486]
MLRSIGRHMVFSRLLCVSASVLSVKGVRVQSRIHNSLNFRCICALHEKPPESLPVGPCQRRLVPFYFVLVGSFYWFKRRVVVARTSVIIIIKMPISTNAKAWLSLQYHCCTCAV